MLLLLKELYLLSDLRFTLSLGKIVGVSLLLITAFFHSALTISEIFDDYIHVEKIKIVANKLLYFLAIIIPLITIIVLLKFNL